MRDQKLSITDLVLQKSRGYTRHFQKTSLEASVKRDFDLQVQASLEQQEQLNTTREIPFDQYLSNYFSKDAQAGNIHAQEKLRNLPGGFIKNLK